MNDTQRQQIKEFRGKGYGYGRIAQMLSLSEKCRNKWWNSNLDKVNRKANYEFICPHCKKPFSAYGNKNRKYCSHACYIEDRFGGAE